MPDYNVRGDLSVPSHCLNTAYSFDFSNLAGQKHTRNKSV